MTVYVDDMHADPMGSFRGMKMSHMIADTTAELLAMADTIGVQRRWLQKPGTPREHFDIALAKRALAVKAGAVEITMRQASAMTSLRQLGHPMGDPATALERRRIAQDQRLAELGRRPEPKDDAA